MKCPSEIVGNDAMEKLRKAGFVVVPKGAIGAAQREAVAQYVKDSKGEST